ncbi:MAG: SpoIIE family protein phosphatase [Deltaproteobacteria bacterium]|nr:SpoIIE family protein phosphatase [Deltaproteobacteria bacterium]
MTHSVSESLDAVHRLSAAIARADDLTQVYQLILNCVVELFDVERASIMTYDEAIGGLRVVASHGIDRAIAERAVVRIGEGISGRVFQRHEPLLVSDIKAEQLGPSRGGYKTNSLMSAPVTCFPLKVGEEGLGVINVTDRRDQRPFTKDDVQLLTTIANQAASYLHMCQLSEKLKAGERLREQLEIARQIQYRLLPVIPTNIEGLDVAGRLVTAERVGGDYYDCFPAHPKRPAFVVADVSGHSIGAAMIMAAFRASVRAQQDSDYSPAMLAQRVNQILFEDLFQAEQFISMVYLQYARSRQVIQLTNGGHPPPLLMRAREGKVEWLSTDDPLLGIESHSIFHEKKLVVAPGDVLVLYTDGVIEAANPSGERFGTERLVACVADAVHGSAQQMVDVLVESVSAFIDPSVPRDDITALVIKVV